jgi:Protein of unknown function (DUF2946)
MAIIVLNRILAAFLLAAFLFATIGKEAHHLFAHHHESRHCEAKNKETHLHDEHFHHEDCPLCLYHLTHAAPPKYLTLTQSVQATPETILPVEKTYLNWQPHRRLPARAPPFLAA